MLEHGANANAVDCNGVSAVQYLLQSEGIYRQSEKPAFTASRLKVKEELIEVLFKNGANCTHDALRYVEDLSVAKIILKYYTSDDINMIDSNNWTSLHHILVNSQTKAELIEFLIENGAKVEDTFNPTFDLAKKQCKFSITEDYLIENIHLLSSCGNELLSLHCDNVENVGRLLNLGADPNKLKQNNSSPLYDARKNPQVVKLLFENGANPFLGFPQKTSFLFCIFREILEINVIEDHENIKVLNEWYYILELLLKMPNISNPVISCETYNMINQCYGVLPEYYKLKSLEIKPRLQIIFELFSKVNPRILSVITPSQIFCFNNMEFASTSLDSISRVLTICLNSHRLTTISQRLFKKEDFILFMLSCGFNIQTCNSVNVLTVILMLQTSEKEIEKNMVQELINRNVNVESIALQITDASLLKEYSPLTMNYNINEVKYLRMIFKIPDAILISFLNNKFDIIELLLPHWYGPPLALIMLHSVKVIVPRTDSKLQLDLEHFICLFNLLVKYGGVPHGTEMYSRFINTVQQMIDYQLTSTVGVELQNENTCEMKTISDEMKQLKSKFAFKVLNLLV
jgi:hypothetical protein